MYIYKKQFHSDAYFVALILMAANLPLSRFGMSFMEFTLLGLWLWAGFSFETAFSFFIRNKFLAGLGSFVLYIARLSYTNVVEKFKLFFRNKAAMVLVSLFLLHLIGLLYTSDFAYAFKDLRTKLPLLAFPVILATMEPLSQRKFSIIMLFHAAAVLIGTFVSTYILVEGEFTDIRMISVFISPIRFSLNICIAIFSLVYFIYKRECFNTMMKVVFLIFTIWLVSFLFILESGIGLIVIITVSLLLLLFMVYKQKNLLLKVALAAIIVLTPIFLYLYIKGIVDEYSNVEPVEISELDEYTQFGNPYVHDTVYYGVEDGRYVGLYLSQKELSDAWNLRSETNYRGRDRNNQEIKYTLIRFLTSKGFRKDAAGVNKLSDAEVCAIERGIANVNYLKNPSLRTRISKIMIGYHNYKYDDDPNGSSVLQRIEYWKASLGIISENLILGVGTGDLKTAFADYYEKTDSRLNISNRWRSHNQYLSIFVAFGFIGFLWFLFTLFYPPIKTRMIFDYFYFVFFVTILLSMLTEDTIETQAGVTLFAFFNSFLLFVRKKDELPVAE